MRFKPALAVAALALLLPLVAARSGEAAETVRLGATQVITCAPLAIAVAKGYFTAEGLDPKFTYFESQAPIAVAVASGDLDFGDGAQTAALYNLAAGGRLRIIASSMAEAPSFHSPALVASNQAYAAGLTSAHDLPGHSFALTQMGTSLQYNLVQIAAREGFDVNKVTLLPLQSNPNITSALSGGRADAAIFNSTNAIPLIQKGDAKLLGWAGDLAGYIQASLVFASSDMLDHHGDTVKKFLAAYRKATQDYYAAFTDAQGVRKDGPTAAATLDVIAQWIGQPPERVALGLGYFDRESRVDMAETQKQLDWYRSIGAIKSELKAATVVDTRFAMTQAGSPIQAH